MKLIEVTNPELIPFEELVEWNTFLYEDEIYVKIRDRSPDNCFCLNTKITCNFDLETEIVPIAITEIKYYR